MENTLIADVKHILVRDLHAMAGEVTDTPDEYLWEALPGVINPVGTLALHICGNLHHFIGALLGSDGYQRDRDREFNLRDIPKQQLLAEIADTVKAVTAALDGFDPARLNDPMPTPPPHHQGRTIGFFLVQLCCHTHRHQGQLNYLRRIKSAIQ